MSIRSSALGLAAVIVLMGAGAAQSLADSNTVFTDDIVDGNVTSADVLNNSLTGADINPGRRVVQRALTIAIETEPIFSVACPAGTTVSGGGFRAANSDVYVIDSYPYGTTWRIRAANWGDAAATMTAYAICDAL